MATIKFIKPKKEIQTDGFLIDFDLIKSGPLTVVIEDKYPEFIEEEPLPEEASELEIFGDFIIKEKENIIFQNKNATARVKLQKTAPASSAAQTAVNVVEGAIPSFKFRQFYYRLTDDAAKATLKSDNTIQFNPGDIKPITHFPTEYRVRYLNQNGQQSIIYRFDIIASDFSNGNNLLEILIKDEDNDEVLLDSLEIDVTQGGILDFDNRSVKVVRPENSEEEMTKPNELVSPLKSKQKPSLKKSPKI